MEQSAEMADKKDEALELAQGPAATEIADIKPTQTIPTPDTKPEPVRIFGIKITGSVGNIISNISNWGSRKRRGAIEATPGVIVNHSTNVIGSLQLTAEMLMFKGGGYDLVNKENRKKPLSYLIDPPKNIFNSVFQKAKFEIKANPLKKSFYTEMPKNIRESIAGLKDLEKATIRDSLNGTVKLTNKWSARSAFAGICGMTIALILPDKKDTAEETERMTKLAKDKPTEYYGLRVYQSLNPIEWWNHKRQFAGLGMTIAGVLSAVSGFRQVEGKIPGQQKYMRNVAQTLGGIITTLGGSQLLFAVDNDSGWRRFGVTQMVRMTTLPKSIMDRFKHNEQGAAWYLGGQAVFQTKNVFAAFVGGAEKRDDGTIVDHVAMRKEAAQKVKIAHDLRRIEKQHAKQEFGSENLTNPDIEKLLVDAPAIPNSSITHASAPERAMPERVKPEMEVAAAT